MKIDFRELDQKQLERAAQHYEEHGYFLLTGIEQVVTAAYRPILAAIIGVRERELDGLFAPDRPMGILPEEVRQQLARVKTTESLAAALIGRLEPVLRRLVGPLLHISSSFHAQFKGAPVKSVDHGGYGQDYLEVHGPYLLHQDFTGAKMPTSPSAVTLWTGLNTTPDWNLRLYPGSHRAGMLCNRWIDLTDPRLEPFGNPVDIAAEVGTAVIFNAMLLHGTSNAGPRQRVSCDIRFFPLCGFLPSEVRTAGPASIADIDSLSATAPGPVLRAPLSETRIFLGEDVPLEDAPAHSVANWVNYINLETRGRHLDALRYLEAFTNREIGIDPPEVYAAKFHKYPARPETAERARQILAGGMASEIGVAAHAK
jgi:hypothetical protein